MQRPNPVNAIAQHRQQFALGQRQSPPADASELAMEIYVGLVIDLAQCGDLSKVVDQEHLRQLALASQAAATAFFQTLTEGQQPNG